MDDQLFRTLRGKYMHINRSTSPFRQRGLSFIGVIFVGLIAVAAFAIGGQSVPIFLEYQAINKAAAKAAKEGTTVADVRASFDRAAAIDTINSIQGKDLEVTKRGDKVKGPIKSITDFGVFVGLTAGIDGLVHLSDLSWNEPGEAAVRNYKKGQEVEAIVLGIDVERERISLGIKQLDSDPFTNFTTLNDRGATVTGTVKTVDAKGAEITLGDDITGYLRASEISTDRVEDARNVLKEGDEVTALITNIDRKSRSIQLSIKAKDNAEQQEAIQSLRADTTKEGSGTTSLGALLKAKLDQNNG